jgi:CubicO group peptidase (beta-lactamase class C family)
MRVLKKMAREIRERKLNVHGIEVCRDGEISRCFESDVRRPVYSATKAFTSAAVGLAADEGKIDVEAPIAEMLERKYLALLDDDSRRAFSRLPLKRFLTMSVPGFPFRPGGSDWLEFALTCGADFSAEPAFSYTNISAYLVGVACENAVGMHLYKYLKPRLFDPLGIENPKYQNCPGGHFYGATGMYLTVHELASLGQLLLNKGNFRGERLLSEDWVKAAVSPQIKTPDGGYGYFIWTYPDFYCISGKWGQKCMIYPQKNLTVTYLSDMPENADNMFDIAKKYVNMCDI